jgi:hypothetical protein
MSISMLGLPKAKADGWYLLHDGKRHGPFPISAFEKAVEEGTITKDHLIWRPGWEDWRSGRAAAELLGGSPADEGPADPKSKERPYQGPLMQRFFGADATPPPAPTAEQIELKKAAEQKAERAAIAAIKAEPARIEEPSYEAAESESAQVWPEDLKFLQDEDLRFLQEPVSPPPVPLEYEQRNYFVRHWLGELSLPKSYWINMVLAVIAICFSAFALRAALQNSGVESGLVALSAWIVFGIVVLVIVSWQLVGVWRSASQHQERGGSLFWARAAQAMVVLGASAAVITAVADSSRFATSGTYASAAATEKVRDALTKIPVYATLQRIDPLAFDNMTGQLAGDFRQGASEDAIYVQARSVLGPTIKQYTPRASEDAILDMTEVMVAYMNALQSSDPESCVALNDSSIGARLRADLAKQFPAIFDRELAVNERILATGAGNVASVPAETQIKPQLNTIQAQLTRRFDQKLGLLAKRNLAPSEYGTYCQIARALLEEIRRLPPKQAADLLRYVYAQS